MATTRMSGWKKGCLVTGVGCFSLVVLAIVGVGLALVWAGASVRELGEPTPEPVSRIVAQGVGATGEGPVEPVRLVIDMQEGAFEVRPGPPGSDITVDGVYDKDYYALTETNMAARRTTSIRFRSSQSLFVRLLAGLMAGSTHNPNHLVVTIPEAMPLDLTLRFGRGSSTVDLGGLTLTGLDVDVSMGDHELRFGRPLAARLPHVRLTGQIGDITFRDLGNARAADLDASTGMGDITIDLGGAWPRGSAAVSVTHAMGNLRLRIPNNVHLSADSSSRALLADSGGLDTSDETDDPDAPRLELHLSASLGEARVGRY